MKIRSGFVSNSSSSSFLVVDHSGKMDELPAEMQELVIGKNGETEFGWGPGRCRDIYSRINFAYLQIMYTMDESWLKMFQNVIKCNSNVRAIKSKISEDFDTKSGVYGYIDHQSSAIEGQNTEIFKSEEVLKKFIFGHSSEIVLDNDNY